MIKRSLYIMAVLLYSAVEVDAMSLKETLQSEDIVLNFENGGTIWCEYYDKNGFAPHPGYINKSEYLYDSNTYYLNMNTLHILSNTSIGGGGCSIPSLLASISGNSNISLQYSESNDKVNNEVIKSITFAGDNSGFTGTFFLHPAITRIVFEKEESVISNISIPDVFPNNSCKCINNQQNFQKSINIYLPNNGRFGDLNVLCNSKVILNSLCYHKSNLYFLNIKHFENNFSVANNISLVQLKYKTYGLQDININTTQNVIKMKENYYKALINRDEKTIQTIIKDKNKIKRNLIKTQEKLISTEKDLNNTCKELKNTKNTLNEKEEALRQAVAAAVDNFKAEEAQYTTINCLATANKSGFTYTLTCGNCTMKLNTTTIININNELNHSTPVGESKYFKDKNDIWTVLTNKSILQCTNITANCNLQFRQDKINLIKQSTSYLKFEPTADGTDKKQWKLKCSACDDDIYTIAGTEYASIDDLINKAKQNNTNNNTCTCNALRIGVEEISERELDAYYVENPVVLVGKCDIKHDYGSDQAPTSVHYYYTELKCNTCNNLISDLNINNKPSELFNILRCNTCKHNFTAQNIEVTSWIYPRYFADKFIYSLPCMNCGFDNNGIAQLDYVNYSTNPPTVSANIFNNDENHFYCDQCGATCYYNEEYIIEELIKLNEIKIYFKI